MAAAQQLLQKGLPHRIDVGCVVVLIRPDPPLALATCNSGTERRTSGR